MKSVNNNFSKLTEKAAIGPNKYISILSIFLFMRIAILAQEEPVVLGPMIIKLMERLKNEICLVAVSGSRDGGKKVRGIGQKLERLRIYWIIFEPKGFIKVLSRKIRWLLLSKLPRFFPNLGLSKHNSIKKSAAALKIKCIHFETLDTRIKRELEKSKPDVIINQTDFILDKTFLKIPMMGVISRHGSILPKFRGRMASFWSHFYGNEYGNTIHFVTKKIDAGPIIMQRKCQIDNRLPFLEVMDILFNEGAIDLEKSIDKLRRKSFMPLPVRKQGGRFNKFPNLYEAMLYRRIIHGRRN